MAGIRRYQSTSQVLLTLTTTQAKTAVALVQPVTVQRSALVARRPPGPPVEPDNKGNNIRKGCGCVAKMGYGDVCESDMYAWASLFID